MNGLTKQDINNALQQQVNLLMTRLASKQEINDAVHSISQKICSKEDMQFVMDRLKDRFTDRFIPSFHDQHNAIKQLMSQIENLNTQLQRLEARLVETQDMVNTIKSETELVMNRTRLNQIPLNGNIASTSNVT